MRLVFWKSNQQRVEVIEKPVEPRSLTGIEKHEIEENEKRNKWIGERLQTIRDEIAELERGISPTLMKIDELRRQLPQYAYSVYSPIPQSDLHYQSYLSHAQAFANLSGLFYYGGNLSDCGKAGK